MKTFSITDIGAKRTTNQDYVYCNETKIGTFPNMFLVADGMGGHNAGDFASKFCVEEFIRRIRESTERTIIGKIEKAIIQTNEALLLQSQANKELAGMGTTFVFASIFDKTMYVANIGDSRLYLLDDTIHQVTQDHSLVEQMIRNGEIKREEARFHPNKNVITRALGVNSPIEADYFEVDLKKGDIILMCSDGLSNMISDLDIFSIVKEHKDNLEVAAKALVTQANENGGKDNISIILVAYEE